MTETATESGPARDLSHRIRRMSGRDPDERQRVASSLELLFDLTFVIGFGQAASLFAHAVVGGHIWPGIQGFVFAVFAICWAWINFAWFASAFDTDDWLYRVLVMIQMIGVIILSLGLPDVFHSLEQGGHLDNRVVVLGYVIMRVTMIAQWARVAKHNPQFRASAMTMIVTLVVSQVGWIVVALLDPTVGEFFVCWVVLIAIELIGPVRAEARGGGTPWHAHHIAERYGLLAIICLGEGVVGTVATLSAVIESQGWTVDVALVAIAGTGLTFGMWWIYFIVPTAEVLHAHRERSFVWGYSQIVLFGSIVGTGAGLDVAAYYIEGESELSALATVLAVAIPVAGYISMIFFSYGYLLRRLNGFHVGLYGAGMAVLGLATLLAAQGVSMTACLVVVTCSPLVIVAGYELVGHRHAAADLARQTAGQAG
jgi:low temperature requirement protein LtrA